MDRPILFSGPMVRALLAGTKTQTRRVVKVPHENPLGRWEVLPWGGPNGGRTRDGKTVPFQNVIGHTRTGEIIGCPYGQPGDRLWVREAWARTSVFPGREMVVYRECDNRTDYGGPWKPGIHMFRRDSRITLEVTGVRVERLQDISEADALAEGIVPAGDGNGYQLADSTHYSGNPIDSYFSLWEHINGPGSVEANPWVWVVEFKRTEA